MRIRKNHRIVARCICAVFTAISLLFTGGNARIANAHYQHANTETIVGHVTLPTGTFPSQHGMVGNVWFDREAGELAYNIKDPDHLIIPTRESHLI